jgi:hypothetical protein
MSMKYMAVLSLLTTVGWGQTSPHTPHLEYGRDHAATATVYTPTSAATPAPHQEGQRPLSFDNIFHVIEPLADGTYAENTDPLKIVFSLKNAQDQEMHFAVDKKLLLKYAGVIRELYDTDAFPSSTGEYVLKEVISLNNAANPLFHNIHQMGTFQTLINLLFTYDQNREAFEQGKIFDIKQEEIPALLNLGSYLFSHNMRQQWGSKIENDLGFFKALLRSCSSTIFYPQSLQSLQEETQDGPLPRLPLPEDIYDTAISIAKLSDVYPFYEALEKLSENTDITLDLAAFRLLEKLKAYFTPAKLSIAWTELKAMPHRSSTQQDALERLSKDFINFVDITPGQDVSQTHILITPSELNQNTTVNKFFTQNPDKTLIVNFGSITTIKERFSVPPGIRNLLIVGERITTIGDEFLSGGGYLTSLILPPNLTTVGGSFLRGCSGLTSLVLPSTLKTVGDGFLRGCLRLTTLDLSQLTLTTVDDYFLSDCSSLTSIKLPPTLTTVGSHFLGGCSGLISLDLSPLINLTTVGDNFLGGCSSLTSLILPSNLTTVGNNFLSNCTRLTSLILPSTLTTVGDSFLYRCWALTSIKLPPNVNNSG